MSHFRHEEEELTSTLVMGAGFTHEPEKHKVLKAKSPCGYVSVCSA
jgi:hypothetical protein